MLFGVHRADKTCKSLKSSNKCKNLFKEFFYFLKVPKMNCAIGSLVNYIQYRKSLTSRSVRECSLNVIRLVRGGRHNICIFLLLFLKYVYRHLYKIFSVSYTHYSRMFLFDDHDIMLYHKLHTHL